MSTGEVLRVRAAMKPISTDPARAAHGRRRDRRGGDGAPPALGRVRRAGRRRRRRGDGGAGARRRRRSRSSAATRSPRPRATSTAYLAGPGQLGEPAGSCWSARPAPARPPSARLLAARLGVDVPRHRRATSRPPPGSRSPTSSSTTARRTSARSSRLPSSAALAEHDGVLALGGGAVLDPRPAALLAGHRVVFLDVGLADAVARVGLGAPGRCCSATSAGQLKAAARRAPAALRAVARSHGVAPTADSRGGRGRGRHARDVAARR